GRAPAVRLDLQPDRDVVTKGSFRAKLIPYLTILPGGLWLIVFFVVPMIAMLSLSLQQGDVVHGFQQVWHFQTYWTSIKAYRSQIIRSLEYGFISTVLQIIIAYPIAYWIAFRGGSRKSFYLFLLLLPFFVSFVLRTVSWNFILADNGIVLGTLKDAGILPQSFHVLATGAAVIGGLTSTYLPSPLFPLPP